MKNKILLFLLLFISLNHSKLLALTDEEIEGYKKGITRASFVSGAVGVGGFLGDLWAVDIATKVILKTVNAGPPLYNLTVGSAVSGKLLIDAIPIASTRGAIVGAAVAAFVAPIAWDCSGSVANSCKRIFNTHTQENVPEEEKATKKDYIATGVTGLGVGLLLYSIFWK